jgi:outer membrane PBP1 activator LpoA protein
MQRISFLIILVAALYVSRLAYATDAAPSGNVKSEPVATIKAIPHIALLLPLKSAVFSRAAQSVRQGFLTAASHEALSLPVQVYECTDESTEIVALYQQAVAGGARAVAGPLTRNGVAALANFSGITVPTLALNLAESNKSDQLFFFGLTAELEARQIAQLAFANGLRNASVVGSGAPLSRRLSQAFSAEWKILGGHLNAEILYQDDPAVLDNLPLMEGNMVFLAADAETAQLIRPYLNIALPVYATSQIFIGNIDTLTNFDLHGIHFIDMPWLLQPDHPAVMIYARANPPLEPDMERLYALGIDAFRLLQIMLGNHFRTALPLDGVTGRLTLNNHRQFQREATQALFWRGQGLTPEAVAAQEAALATAKAAAASSILPASAPSVVPLP